MRYEVPFRERPPARASDRPIPTTATAVKGVYTARHRGRSVTVFGPERLYPSGLYYYRIVGGTEFIPAAELEWIKPPRCHATDRIVGFARKSIARLSH